MEVTTRRTSIAAIALLLFGASFLLGCQPPAASQSTPAATLVTETPAVGAPGAAEQDGKPMLTLVPRAGSRGTDLKLTGVGFLPGETIAVTLNDIQGAKNLGTATVDSNGQFPETTMKLPDGLEIGEYVIGVTGLQSGKVAEDKFRVRQDAATIELDKYTGRPGLPLAITGNGFAPGEMVDIYFEDTPVLKVGQVQADEIGRLDAKDLQLPFVTEGTHTLIVQGEDSQVKLDRSFLMYGFHPWVVLEPYALAPGASMDVSGYGFIPGETVKAFLDDTTGEPMMSFEADWEGKIFRRAALTADAAQIGQHKLVVVGSNSNEASEYPFQVMQFFPNIDLVPYAGPPGTKVAIEGQGFAPGETVRVYLGEGTEKEVTNFQADKDGFVRGTGSFSIDYSAGKGDLPVTAVGDASKSSVTRNFGVLAGDPWISLSDYAGIVGKQITVKGGGFGAGEKISIMVGSEKVASAVADAAGEFQGTGPVVISDSGSGTVTITVKGDNSGGKTTANYTVTP